jgi:peptide/nickel transport system substrate-binding protein
MNAKDCPPLQNVKVRQALNYAVDRDSIIKGVLDGYATKIATIATPEYEGYDSSISPYEYNPEKAKQLLTEAGYPNGFSVEFSATNATVNGTDVVQAIAAQGERYSTFSNPAFDALREKAITTDDKDQRLKLDSDLQAMAKDLAPAIFLWQQQVLYAYNANRVTGWVPRVDEMIVVSGADVK